MNLRNPMNPLNLLNKGERHFDGSINPGEVVIGLAALWAAYKIISGIAKGVNKAINYPAQKKA